MNLSDFKPKSRRPNYQMAIAGATRAKADETLRTTEKPARDALDLIIHFSEGLGRFSPPKTHLRQQAILSFQNHSTIEPFIDRRIGPNVAEQLPISDAAKRQFADDLEMLRRNNCERLADLLKRNAPIREINSAIDTETGSAFLRGVFLRALANRNHVAEDLANISGLTTAEDMARQPRVAADYILGLRTLRLGKMALES